MTSKQSSHTIERPPVVVVMGHVDHGKSTLLDYIRHANTIAKEFGGITQHVAAYEVEREYEGATKRITFIDTPGHAAFAAIRARGANIADIAILVVAADDGVKAQTLEALQAIRASNIPFIVAINKIDKPNANIERTQATLMEHGVYLEQLGGDVPWAAISAKQGTGVDSLLDLILIVAEVGEYRASDDTYASGYVIEAHRDQKRGIAATLIISDGSIEGGMYITAGAALAPVRLMENHAGKQIKHATFSSPITIVGFDELPTVGDVFTSYTNKKDAEAARAENIAAQHASTHVLGAVGSVYTLPLIVRADTTGSIEAIEHEIAHIGGEEYRVQIIQSGIGTITEGDIKSALSSAVMPVVVGFNVGIDPVAESLSRERSVSVEYFNIIYKMTDMLTEKLQTSRPKQSVVEVRGSAKVLALFSASKLERTVGAEVTSGFLPKQGKIRVMRRNEEVGGGVILSIQANKQHVDKIEADRQCGMSIETEDDIQINDTLEYVVTTQQ